ncbi:MAG TPA: hypothetical protein V6C78_13600, partial [Crinalium sp.]
VRPGKGEIDTFSGGSGRDLFVLGNTSKVFYDDFRRTSVGTADYAIIADFNRTVDKIQLKGAASNYILRNSPSFGSRGDVAILLDQKTGPDEVIGLIRGVNRLNLIRSYFVYV